MLVEVHWSSVNYKDGLASTPTGKVARISPIVPGIDLAGVTVEDAPGIPAGTAVLAHGYDIGVSRHGGFAEYARVPAEWLVPLPDGLSAREAMVVGTAGFTAAHVGDRPAGARRHARQGRGARHRRHRRRRLDAVGMLAGLGYEVVASTGKPESAEFLTSLGASSVIDRSELSEEGKRPLESTLWAGAVDCVGGVTLANVLKKIHYGGSVAASGLTGGGGLPTTVMPFILRGVNLLGIDSVLLPIERRRAVWQRIATDLRPRGLDRIGHDVTLEELDDVLSAILRGEARGRAVVEPARPIRGVTRFTSCSSPGRWQTSRRAGHWDDDRARA